jgi:hypothetical protein
LKELSESSVEFGSARAAPEAADSFEIRLTRIGRIAETADRGAFPDFIHSLAALDPVFSAEHDTPPERLPYGPLHQEKKSDDVRFLHRSPSDGTQEETAPIRSDHPAAPPTRTDCRKDRTCRPIIERGDGKADRLSPI